MSTAAKPISSFEIHRANRAFAQAQNLELGADGMVSQIRARLGRVALSCGVATVGALVVIKAALFALLGTQGYDHALTALANGDAAERAAGWVMQADGLTRILAGVMSLPIF